MNSNSSNLNSNTPAAPQNNNPKNKPGPSYDPNILKRYGPNNPPKNKAAVVDWLNGMNSEQLEICIASDKLSVQMIKESMPELDLEELSKNPLTTDKDMTVGEFSKLLEAELAQRKADEAEQKEHWVMTEDARGICEVFAAVIGMDVEVNHRTNEVKPMLSANPESNSADHLTMKFVFLANLAYLGILDSPWAGITGDTKHKDPSGDEWHIDKLLLTDSVILPTTNLQRARTMVMAYFSLSMVMNANVNHYQRGELGGRNVWESFMQFFVVGDSDASHCEDCKERCKSEQQVKDWLFNTARWFMDEINKAEPNEPAVHIKDIRHLKHLGELGANDFAAQRN